MSTTKSGSAAVLQIEATRLGLRHVVREPTRKKVNELVVHIEIDRYDVMGIMVTWLQGDQDWELTIQGNTPYQKDRQMGRGGGVALLVRNEIKSIARNKVGQELGRKTHQKIEKVCKKGKVTVIMRDFNMQVDWENQ
eukprot:g34375.t1